MITICVVDDDKNFQFTIKKILKKNHYEVISARTRKEAEAVLDTADINVLILDQNLPDGTGFDILQTLTDKGHSIPVIFVTGFSEIDFAIKAMQMGAIDYITKPLDTPRLLTSIQQCLSLDTLKKENQGLKEILKGGEATSFYFKSSKMEDVYEMVKKVSGTPYTTFIQGESGVGKELIAKIIHEKSQRKGLFIPIDCGAIPKTLIESELFGHTKGAFTDAQFSKPGVFEVANKGTLFLDEIGNLPSIAQSQLLRVLQEREVKRVGDTETIPVDTRIIAATNIDIQDAIGSGHFREDLWHRLSEFVISIPSLRERSDDIMPLSEYFLLEKNKQLKTQLTFSPQSIKLLKNHSWPGNVRELKNCINRASVMATTVIEPTHMRMIPPSNKKSKDIIEVSTQLTMKAATQYTELQLLKHALDSCQYNKLAASKKLGMYYASFCQKLKLHNL
jgi:DNA-binding NtrC family response regulator